MRWLSSSSCHPVLDLYRPSVATRDAVARGEGRRPIRGCLGGTYSQGDLAAFDYLLGEDAEEVEDGGVALDIVAEGGDDGGEHILPVLHLYGQYRQAHAELNADRLGPAGVVL